MIHHWGLLRRPLLHTDVSISRLDTLAVSMTALTVLMAVWTLLTLLGSTPPRIASIDASTSLRVVCGLGLLLAALGAAWPPSKIKPDSAFGAFVTYARFKGDLGRLDVGIAIVAATALVALAVGAVLGLTGGSQRTFAPATLIALVGVAASALISALLQLRMRGIGVNSRGASGALSRYVRESGRDVDVVPTLPVPVAEADATFRYSFPVAGSEQGEVGVRIPEDVMSALRALNKAHGGRLFVADEYAGTVAVVNGIAQPVNGIGVSEMRRLADMICPYALSRGWTPLRLANEILHFVQHHFRYVSDETSTQAKLGESYTDYGRFPLETLADGEGDCECTTFLCSALLAHCGLDNFVLYVSITEGKTVEHHAATGLPSYLAPISVSAEMHTDYVRHEGAVILYGETTGAGQGFGTIPLTWRSGFQVRKVVPIPAWRSGRA